MNTHTSHSTTLAVINSAISGLPLLGNVIALVGILTLSSAAAFAEEVASGGWGTDGATLESMPNESSVKDAAAVYAALSFAESAKGKEFATEDGEEFSCKRPKSGIHTLVAGCEIALRSSTSKFVIEGRTVAFEGKLAAALFDALNVSGKATEERRVGATSRSAGNLSCSKATRGRVSCTIDGILLAKFSI